MEKPSVQAFMVSLRFFIKPMPKTEIKVEKTIKLYLQNNFTMLY